MSIVCLPCLLQREEEFFLSSFTCLLTNVFSSRIFFDFTTMSCLAILPSVCHLGGPGDGHGLPQPAIRNDTLTGAAHHGHAADGVAWGRPWRAGAWTGRRDERHGCGEAERRRRARQHYRGVWLQQRKHGHAFISPTPSTILSFLLFIFLLYVFY